MHACVCGRTPNPHQRTSSTQVAQSPPAALFLREGVAPHVGEGAAAHVGRVFALVCAVERWRGQSSWPQPAVCNTSDHSLHEVRGQRDKGGWVGGGTRGEKKWQKRDSM